MPAGYTVSVPSTLSLKAGQSAKLVLTLAGPKPITLNAPHKPDDYIAVRFTVNPQVVSVVGARMLQTLDHNAPGDINTFGFTWTGRAEEKLSNVPPPTKRTFIVYQWLFEGPGSAGETPLDVAMGPLIEVELLGVRKGQCQLDVVSAFFGEFDVNTNTADGTVSVS